jgi:hypothetical protein
MQKIRSIIRVVGLFFLKLPKKVFTHKAGFILLGISSTVWFLIRVIPKPQRSNFPCMEAAAPMMSGLVVYLLSLWGTVAAYQRKVLDALDSPGLIQYTIIVLWGDHGWHLGDHDLWCKHTNFENATRAPLIISAPGIFKGITKSTTEFVDIFPTLCDLTGLKIPKILMGKAYYP